MRAGEPPEPYIEHVRRVAGHFLSNSREAAVAWLHDVVEDTDLTFEDLEKIGVKRHIVDAVRLLTHPHRITIDQYLEHIQELAETTGLPARVAKAVKLADLSDNLGAIERLESTRPGVSRILGKRYAGAFEILDPKRSVNDAARSG
jgi:(p)ppGpp synthase/HD superfamily hydrolase